MLAMLRNPKTVTMFDQFMSYQIAMDLLLRNKMYNEVMEVFAISQERSIQDNKFPKNCFILAMAALYRMVRSGIIVQSLFYLILYIPYT